VPSEGLWIDHVVGDVHMDIRRIFVNTHMALMFFKT
jgi:hypothetical protein